MTRRIFCKVLLVVVAAFGILFLSNVLLAQGRRGRSEDPFEHARKAQKKHTDRLMAIDGVEGTAIGFDLKGRRAIKVFTAGPGDRGIPEELDDVPVDVVITGKIYALPKGRKSGKRPKPNTEYSDNPFWYERPVPIGVSTGNIESNSAGTIGCRVTDGSNVYALSNNHVYALENTASDDSIILQPGRYDGGTAEDAIGTLYDFEPIVFSRWARNEIDAAIALSSTLFLGNATPAGGYGTPNSSIAQAFVGQDVQKFGRTTGLTKGEVTYVNATVKVGYSRGTARFVKQIIVESGTPFIGGGDSGSLLVTDNTDLNPVGLLFAGTGDGLLAVANRIDLVLDRFNVTVDDSAEGQVNNPPVANSQSVETEQDTDVVITLSASDVENDPLIYIVVSLPSNGSLTEGATTITSVPYNLGGAIVTYAPSSEYTGQDSFTFKVNDGTVDSEPATVSITVTPVNHPPVADSQSVATDEDVSIAITLTASDVDDDALTYSIVEPSHGTLSGTAPNVTYTPNANYNGSDSFTFKVSDGKAESKSATVSITVNAVNDKPIADDQFVETTQDTPVDIVLTGSDVDDVSLTYSVVDGPSNGTLSGTAASVTYTPEADYIGSDSFTFNVGDGELESEPATVSISVNPAAPPTEESTFSGTVPPKGESRHTVTIASPGAASMYVRLTWSGWGDLRLRVYNSAGNKVVERDKSSWRNRVEETTIYNLEPGDWQVAAKSDSRRSSIDYTIEVVVEY